MSDTKEERLGRAKRAAKACKANIQDVTDALKFARELDETTFKSLSEAFYLMDRIEKAARAKIEEMR